MDILARPVPKGLEAAIREGEIRPDTVAEEIESWRTPDDEGKLTGFAHVAARYLEDEFP